MDAKNWKDPNSGFLERQKLLKKQDLMGHESYKEGYNPSNNRICDRLQGDISEYPYISLLLDKFYSTEFVSKISEISGVKDIVVDLGRKSTGLHVGKCGAFIDVHCDHTWNQYINAYNCVNLILFVNKEWQEIWNGHLEFWDESCKERVDVISPIWNRMVIWTNTSKSWHGYPAPLACPENHFRKSLAIFYYTFNVPDGFDKRNSATWRG